MKSSKWNEVTHQSSARQVTGHNVATELTTVWESLTQTKAALRHIENRLDATQRTGVCFDSVSSYPNKKSTRTVPCQDGWEVNGIGGSSKYRWRSQQSPENGSSRSPLRNTTQHSNVHVTSSVEMKEPLASSREAIPPTVSSSQLGTFNLHSVPAALDPFSPAQSDHLLHKPAHLRDIRDKPTVSDPDSTCSFAPESTEVCYLNDHLDPNTPKTNEQSLLEIVRDPARVGAIEDVTLETQGSQNMQGKTSTSCLMSASEAVHQVEGTACPISDSGSQQLGNVRLYQPNDKLEKLKERIRRQRQHLEEAAEEDKLLRYLEKPIPGPGESSSHGTKSMPMTKIRKVTTALPAPVYKGFSVKETKLLTSERKERKEEEEEEFHNLNRDMLRERDVSRLFGELAEVPARKQQQQREWRAVRSNEKMSPKPVRKVSTGLNAKSVISPASWRDGQNLVQMVLGPLPKFPKEDRLRPADRQSKTGQCPELNRQSPHTSRESPPHVQYKHHSLTAPTPTLTDQDKAPIAVRSELLAADIQGILDDLQINSKAAEKESARQVSRGGSSGRRGRQGSGSQGRTPISSWVTTTASTSNSKVCHSLSSKSHQPDTTHAVKAGQKMRHYDPDTVRQYIAWQQEDRRRRHADEKKAQREETERRNRRLQELYKKQREVAKTLAFATEPSVVPVQKQRQESCNKRLPEETHVDKGAAQMSTTGPSVHVRPVYQPSGESDKENKRLESPQSPSSSDRSLVHHRPFPSFSLMMDRCEVASDTTGSPLDANRDSKLAKNSSSLREHILNAHMDRQQPSDTASKMHSPTVRFLQTGVSSRNSVDEVDRESLHNSGASDVSCRGNNEQSEKSGSDGPEAACPGVPGSPLEADPHRDMLKSSERLRGDKLNAHSDRGQPNGTASERDSPSLHPFQTGVAFRNSVEEDHVESLHGSGDSGTSSRGSNAQRPETTAEELRVSQHSAVAPTNRSQSQKSKATFLSDCIETDPYKHVGEMTSCSMQQRRKQATDVEEENMGNMSHHTDHHDSSIGSISEGTLPSEGSLSDEENNASHPSTSHFQVEPGNFSALNLPFAQHDSNKEAWEELNRGSHTSVVNIFIKNLQGPVKASERTSTPAHSLQTGVSSRNSVDENHIESLRNSAASVMSSRGSNVQSLELDSQRSVSDRLEVASPGSPLEVDLPSESLKSSSPARAYNLNTDSTAHRDRAQANGSDELQFSHTALQHLMAAELHGLDSSHMSHRQLVDIERLRGVSMAQQETVSLAQILKAKLQLHEREQSELKVQAEKEALEAMLHLEENRQIMARANVELQERLAATQKETLEGLQEVTTKMMSKQTEVAQYTADAAQHIKEMSKLAHSQAAGTLAVTPGSAMFIRQKEQQPQYNTDSESRCRRSDRRTRQGEHQSSLNSSSQSDSASFRRPNPRGKDSSSSTYSPAHVSSASRNVMMKETTAVKYTKRRSDERVESYLSRSSIEEDIVIAADDSLPSDSIPLMLHEKANSSSVATECSLKLDGSLTEDEVAESSFRALLPSEAQRRGTLEKSHHLEKSEEDRKSQHASLVSEAHISVKSHDGSIAFSGGQDSFSQFTMDMARQFMKDDELRLKHQSFLLRVRQKALKEKTKTELAWLEHQRRTLRDKGEDDKMPPIRKKQRGLILKLQQEQAEIRRLQEANKVARKERQLLLKQQEEIERMRSSTLRLKERLKYAGADTPETPILESLTSEAAFPTTTSADVDTRSPSPPLSVSGSETSSIMQKLKKMHSHMNEKHCSPVHCFFSVFTAQHWASLSVCLPKLDPKLQLFINNQLVRFLTKREQQLMQRRYRAEELLQWKQRLDQEEAEVRRMEKEALAVYGQETPRGSNMGQAQQKEISNTGPSHHQISEQRTHDEKDYVGDGACSTTSESSIHTEIVGSQQPGISPTEQPASAPDTTVFSIQRSLRDYTDDFASSFTSPGVQSFQSPPLKGSISKATSHLEDGNKTKMQFRPISRTGSPAQAQARSQFTESSVSIQAESISDQSDIENRIRALKEELKKRKFMANQLKKEQKKREKERLKAQEASLLKQLESYNDLIEKTQAELNKEPDHKSHVKDVTAQSRIKSPPSLRSEIGKTANPERICDFPVAHDGAPEHDHSRATTVSEELRDEDVLTVPPSPVFDSPESPTSGQRRHQAPQGVLRPSSKEVNTQLTEPRNENSVSNHRFDIREQLEDEVKYSFEEQHSECFLRIEEGNSPESQEKPYIAKHVSSGVDEEPQYSPTVSLKQDREIGTVKSPEVDHAKPLIVSSDKSCAVLEDSQPSPRPAARASTSNHSCTYNSVTPSSKKEALIYDAKSSSLEDYPSDFESSVGLSSREDHHGAKSASQIAVSPAKTNSSSKRSDGKATDSSHAEEIEEDIPEELSCFSNCDGDASHSDVLVNLNLQKEDFKLNNFQSNNSQTPAVSSLQAHEQEEKDDILLQKVADKLCNVCLNDTITQFVEIKKAKNKKVKASNQLRRNLLVGSFEEEEYSDLKEEEETEEPSSPELYDTPKSAVLEASGQEELVKRLAELELSRGLLDELGDEEQTPPRPKLPLPPPPKLPEQPAMVVPHSATEVEKMVHAATLEMWVKYNLKKEGVLTCPPLPKPKASQEYLGSEASGEDQEAACIHSYKKVVYDLTWEILHEIFSDDPNTNLPEWAKPQRVKNPVFQRVKMTNDVGRVQEFITAEILNLYGFTEDLKQPDWQKMLKFGRKKRDRVDQILAQELHEEESQWVTYDEDELFVKNQLADSLFDMLLKDTANTLTQIFDKKAKTDALS
ncbi:centrosome-associated protein 350 isoform X2 [Thalassophryne amazonica]|uniref:centrosome-associated protein 350 isoform X2 n=1 Tax=Thalassophryne amazonica TaxID=390379 RepID=UPI00147228F8|nr:centrosome-associated protein 350 isoform X2 [Thalassophryne amazonica]